MASTITAWASGVRGVAVWPRVMFNSSLDVNLYFKDVATGTFHSWSGATGYTPSIKIRQPKGFNAIPNANVTPFYSGSIDLTDGATTRPIVFNASSGTRTDWSTSPDIYGSDGLLGGYSGASGADAWVFNGGSGGAGVSAAAVWAATRCTYRGTLGSGTQNGTAIIEADSVGNQAALSFTNNTVYPAIEADVTVLRAGTASLRELVLIRIVPEAFATVSSFTQITNGWSCAVPFTDPSFLTISNTANTTISEYQDYDCEIVVTKNSDSSVMVVATSKIRVYRKQISLTI